MIDDLWLIHELLAKELGRPFEIEVDRDIMSRSWAVVVRNLDNGRTAEVDDLDGVELPEKLRSLSSRFDRVARCLILGWRTLDAAERLAFLTPDARYVSQLAALIPEVREAAEPFELCEEPP